MTSVRHAVADLSIHSCLGRRTQPIAACHRVSVRVEQALRETFDGAAIGHADTSAAVAVMLDTEVGGRSNAGATLSVGCRRVASTAQQPQSHDRRDDAHGSQRTPARCA